ncbi:9784_t:CDS:2 [Cetraspora pellucida]|uniref:9784_t:CDS:1 n=1 Tax=Cetraspora pellucida TaxID=1433469 RepID=A0ACA9MJB3_9GLOM|nr:9784_t:CDS:2 [Cetraspora pellucida]
MVDIALNLADEYFLDNIYARFYPIIDNTTTTNLQSALPQLMKHPKFLKNQIRKEIKLSATGFPFTTLVTIPWFLGEVRGYSKLYDDINDYGILYGIFSIVLFLFFTDMFPTPYSSHAFHPLDGYLQSCPYHLFVYLFPLQKIIYIGLFVFVNLWTIMIHDGEYISSGSFINGAAHHTLHHLYFNYNYGQYFTIWDKIGGSHRFPGDEQFDIKKKRDKKVWEKQASEVDTFDEYGKEKKKVNFDVMIDFFS